MTKTIFTLTLITLIALAVLTACDTDSMERVASHALTSADTANDQSRLQAEQVAAQNRELTQQVIEQNQALLVAQKEQAAQIVNLAQGTQFLFGAFLALVIIAVLVFVVVRMRAPAPVGSAPTVILLEHHPVERFVTPSGKEIRVVSPGLPVPYRKGDR